MLTRYTRTSRYTPSPPPFNLPQKVTNYTVHIKFYYEKIREVPRFVFNIGRDEAAQTGGSNNIGTLDIKIEVRTQRTGLSSASSRSIFRLKSQK